jgi:Ca2+-binding RTX toxin-like protein
LDVAAQSIAELGGVTQGTVTRSGLFANPLVVSLYSSDTSEAVVPTTVTIAAGASSATFPVVGIDDGQADGARLVTITGSAANYTSASDTLLVLDDEDGTGGQDHGDDAGTATPVNVPSSTFGNIQGEDDVDWFSFYAYAGNEYQFKTSLGTLHDSVLTLFSTDGTTVIDRNDDAGQDVLASRIDWNASANGWYYLRVAGYDETNSGTYSLLITATGDNTGGTSGGNVIYGSPEADVIYGGGGNDYIQGGAGNDWIDGGLGNDVIYGGDGDDVIYGGSGNDQLYGGAGNDILIGGLGSDNFFGGLGDFVDGGPGVDTFFADYS